MQRTRTAGLAVSLAFLSTVAFAQEDLLDEPRPLEQITFSPPTSASIRQTNGVRRTGKIVSISRESMVYQVGRDNTEVTVEIDDIQRVNTLDNEFTYEPEKEDFDRLKIKARRISYLRVETVQTYVPPPEGFEPTDPPAVTDPPPPIDPAVVSPAATSTQPEMRPEGDPAGDTVNPAETVDPPPVASVDTIPDHDPQPGELILFCSDCQNRLPLSIKNGDRCPHCNIVLWNVGPSGSGGTSAQGRGPHNGGGPGPGTAAFPTVNGEPAGDGSAPPPAEGGGQVVARGTSLSDVPLWMQIGFFVGILIVGWVVFQRR